MIWPMHFPGRLAHIIDTFQADFLRECQGKISPIQRQALNAISTCRGAMRPKMQANCADCGEQRFIPHSCGNRHCPHCQAHESQQWLERQLQKQLPCDYFMITFTLPSEFRPLAWANTALVYDLIIKSAWETLSTFSQNDKKLQGTPGAVAVLHTHTRKLDFHPHVHLVMPAGAIDQKQKLWRVKKNRYLFDHKALAKVYRAKILAGIAQAGLALPRHYPKEWVVDCKNVGTGEKALVYLGRYLYRGVIQEKDIIRCENGQVTFRYTNGKTGKTEFRTLRGVAFLKLFVQHILPKGFRRTRNFGLLHPNSKRLIQLLQLLLRVAFKPFVASPRKRPALICACCGGAMKIVRTQIKSTFARSRPTNDTMRARAV